MLVVNAWKLYQSSTGRASGHTVEWVDVVVRVLSASSPDVKRHPRTVGGSDKAGYSSCWHFSRSLHDVAVFAARFASIVMPRAHLGRAYTRSTGALCLSRQGPATSALTGIDKGCEAFVYIFTFVHEGFYIHSGPHMK